MSAFHIADTGLFVAIGQPSNNRYQAVRRFARRNDITFVLPERVYEELTVDDPDVEPPPVDAAIDEGWVTVAAPLEFSEPIVSGEFITVSTEFNHNLKKNLHELANLLG